MKTRISAAELDQLFWYRAIESKTLEDLKRDLLFYTPPTTDAMAIGTAWAKALEHAESSTSVLEADGYAFIIDADITIDLFDSRETYINHYLKVGGIDVHLTGKVDSIRGGIIVDDKMSSRQADLETKSASMQWRAYLLATNGLQFVYRLWQWWRDAKASREHGKEVIVIKSMQELVLYPYSGMQQDVEQSCAELIEFMAAHTPERIVADDEDYYRKPTLEEA